MKGAIRIICKSVSWHWGALYIPFRWLGQAI